MLGGSYNGEIYFLVVVNIILDIYIFLKKLNYLGIFLNVLNLLKKKVRCILLERRGKGEVFVINCKLIVSLII